jgi:hypothetical protein
VKAKSSDGKNSTELGATAFLEMLQDRFEKNMGRHSGLDWSEIQRKLEKKPEKLSSLQEMERTGGEPDVIGIDAETGQYIFCDCSPESPVGRRNLCYDREAQESREEARPDDNAVDVAGRMEIEILTEEQYMQLQKIGNFDTKTSSWLRTPEEIRECGGAIFGDRRFGRVFVYHNGASSYYSARGFRGILMV